MRDDGWVTPPVDFEQAVLLLGLGPAPTLVEARDRYRELVRRSHPDLAGDAGAEATIELNLAMAAVERHFDRSGDEAPHHRDAPVGSHDSPRADVSTVEPISVVDDALRVEVPPDELYERLAHALDIVGNVTFADASSGYIEAVVSMGNPSPSQLVVSLQGKGTHTEAFFTLEAMGIESPPDLQEVVAAIAEVLAEWPR